MSSDKYFMHIQSERKFNNMFLIYSNKKEQLT